MSRDGKLAAVTNVRLPYHEKKKATARSRGVCSPVVYTCSILATRLVLFNYAHVDLYTNLIKFVSFSLRCSVSDVTFVKIVNTCLLESFVM